MSGPVMIADSDSTAEVQHRAVDVRSVLEAHASAAELAERIDAIGLLLDRAAAMRHPWSAVAGERMGWLRRPLLRILKPYIDRQQELDEITLVATTALAHDVALLRARVDDLLNGAE